MSDFDEPCPFCDRSIGGGNANSATHNLRRHIETQHADEVSPGTEEEFTLDEEPRPVRARVAKKQAGRQRARRSAGPARVSAAGAIPLQVQLQVPYNLLADVTARRLPLFSNQVRASAPAAAAAWDTFLLRYPSLREKIESGMVGADVLALVIVHVEMLRILRAELEMQRSAAEHYEGGIPADQAA